MSYSLIIDVLVAVLLVVTIGYAIVLNKRLGKLRADKGELEKLATTFGHSTHRAEESIDKLKHTADLLQDHMDKAQTLRDDLAFLIDRGDRAADRLEEMVRTTRNGLGAQLPGAAAAMDETADFAGGAHEAADDDEPKSEAERELLKAIRSAR